MLVSKDFEVNECGANFDRNFIFYQAELCKASQWGQSLSGIVFKHFLCHIFFNLLTLFYSYFWFPGGAIKNTLNSQFVVCFRPGG
jgi:hypothetical protein